VKNFPQKMSEFSLILKFYPKKKKKKHFLQKKISPFCWSKSQPNSCPPKNHRLGGGGIVSSNRVEMWVAAVQT